jgi:DNA-binding transcriptional LysR family regulator
MSLTLQQLLNRLSFRQLQVFQAVYQQQGYGRAAEALGLTQPAVSSQIRKLEQALGQPLFEYVGRQLYCTRAGEKVAERINAVFDQVALLQTDLHSLQGQLSGALSICAVSTAQYAVPHLLQDFLSLHPAVNVSLRVMNRAQAIEQLNNNTDDLVVMGLVPSDRSLASLPFLDNELIPVMAAKHPLAVRKQLTPQQFLNGRLLLREPGSGNRLALEQHCQQQRLTLRSYIEIGSNDAIKHGVLAGLGVAVLPKLSVLAELRQGSLVSPDLKGFPLRRSWCLVYPKGKHPTPVMQAFLDHIQSHLKQINQQFSELQAL